MRVRASVSENKQFIVHSLIELGSCCSDLDKQVSDREICRTKSTLEQECATPDLFTVGH